MPNEDTNNEEPPVPDANGAQLASVAHDQAASETTSPSAPVADESALKASKKAARKKGRRGRPRDAPRATVARSHSVLQAL
jgi:hypothetical protein